MERWEGWPQVVLPRQCPILVTGDHGKDSHNGENACLMRKRAAEGERDHT